LAESKPTPKPTSAFGNGQTPGKSAFGGGAPSSGSSFGQPKTTGVKTGTGATPKKNAQDPWAPVLSFGQSVIDTLSTPLYGVQGTIDALLKGKNPIEAAADGANNATAWTRGQRPVTGSGLLKTAGIESNFWNSLAADILLDPLTYTPGVLLTAPLKAAGIASKSAVKAGALAAKGEVAAKAGQEGAKLATGFKAGFQNPRKPMSTWVGGKPVEERIQAVTDASPETKAFLAKYINKQAATRENLVKRNYTTVPITGPRSAGQAVNDVLASAFIAGKQGFIGTLLSVGAKNTLRKYAKTETRLLNKEKQITPKDIAEQVGVSAAVQAPKFDPKIAEDIAAEAEATKTGKQVGIPSIPDTAPTYLEVRKLAEAATPTAEVADLKRSLKAIDKASVAAKVTSFAPTDTAKQVEKILEIKRDLHVKSVSSIDKNMFIRIKRAVVREDNASPFSFYREFAQSPVAEYASIAAKVGGLVVEQPGTGKKFTIAQIARAEASDRNIPLDLIKQASAVVDDVFIKRGTAAGLEALRLDELTRLVGKDLAEAFKATNALNPAKKTNQEALDALKAQLPEPGTVTSTKYDGFDTLINGLKRGDVVDTDSLLKVIRALDPEGKLDAQVEAAMAKDPFVGLKELLTSKQQVNSVTDARNRLNKADPDTMFKATGVAFPEVTTAYFRSVIDGSVEPQPEVLLKSRQEASKDVVVTKNVDRETYEDATNALARGFEGNIKEQIDEKMDFLTVSASGLPVRRSTTEKMSATSKAARPRELNENTMTKVYGSLFGTGTYKASRSKTAARQENRLQDFARKVNMVEKLSLAVYGIRPIVRKQAAGTTKKGEKQHFAFLHLGDFASMALKFGGEFKDVATRALFPQTPGKYDGISTTGLAEAMRMVLESMEKKLPLTKEELVEKLISRGSDQKAWSPEFTARMPQIANDIADQLIKPEVSGALYDFHITRVMADVTDASPLAVEMTQELVDLMEKAYKTALDGGTISTSTTIEAVRQYFYEFVYKSNMLNQTHGPAGEAVLKAAATMFIKDGKVGNLQLIPSDSEELILFREGLAQFYKHTNVDNVAPAGRESFKYPSPKTQEDLQNELTELKKGLDESRAARAGLTTKDAVREWAKNHKKLQTRLDKVRPKAWAAWLETEHWNGQRWVDSRDFDPELAAKIEKENQIFYTDEGPVSVGTVLDETIPANKAPKQTPAQKKAGIKARNEAAVKRGDELAVGAKADAAAHVVAKTDEIERMFPDDPIAQSERMQQEFVQRTFDDADIETWVVRQNYDPPRQLQPNEKPISTRQKMLEKASGTYNKESTVNIMSVAQTSMVNAIKSVQSLAFKIFDDYKGKFTEEEYLNGFQHAIAKTTPTDANPLFTDYVTKLTQLIDPIKDDLAASKDMLKAMDASFDFYKINLALGIKKPSETDDLRNLLHNLPIAKMPDNIKGTDLEGAWNDRVNAFKESGTTPIELIVKISAALQMSKTQMAIGRQAAVQHGQKVTPQRAAELGLVKLKSIGDAKFDLLLGVPEGYYFDKYIAEQIGAMARGWNDIYEKGMPEFIRIVLDLTGMLKATQTVLNPRHHVVTFTGDMITAMLAGVRNPVDYYRALKITFAHAQEDVAANWGKTQADTNFKIMMRRLEAVGGKTYTTGEEDNALSVLIQGKKVTFDNETLRVMFDDKGGLTNPNSNDQLQGAYEAAIGDPLTVLSADEKALKKTQLTKYREGVSKVAGGFQKAISPASSFVSYASNIPRTAHAIHVMRSRNWSSVDEMMGAVVDKLNLNHPTVASLTGWERKYPRSIFTYYTWLKQAHAATINMMMHHTAAVTLFPKIQYNRAEEQGMQPISFGQPWSNKRDTPSYINYSVYGPTYSGPRGAMMMKPAVMPMDVLDTYNFSYDPNFTLDQNFVRNFGQLGQGVIGKNINILAQMPLELITRTNPSTGKPSQVKDAETLMDRLFSLTGASSLAKGLGYTPPNKGEDSANPLTQRDRDLLLQNWLLGLKQSDVYTPANMGNAQSEQSARYNAWLKNYQNK
jgi:hypothetical protein